MIYNKKIKIYLENYKSDIPFKINYNEKLITIYFYNFVKIDMIYYYNEMKNEIRKYIDKNIKQLKHFNINIKMKLIYL